MAYRSRAPDPGALAEFQARALMSYLERRSRVLVVLRFAAPALLIASLCWMPLLLVLYVLAAMFIGAAAVVLRVLPRLGRWRTARRLRSLERQLAGDRLSP